MFLLALNDILGIYWEGQVRRDTGQDKCTQPGREVLAPAFLVLNLHILVTRYPGAPSSLAEVEDKKIPFPVCLGLECGCGICRDAGPVSILTLAGQSSVSKPELVSTYQQGPEMGEGLPSSRKLREMIR